MATHSSTLAWKIPWTEEPGRLQSMGSLRVRHDWATSLSVFTLMHWRRKWQPTPVFLPGESQGRGAWWAAIYGVAQSRTRLKWLSSSSSKQREQSFKNLERYETKHSWLVILGAQGTHPSSTTHSIYVTISSFCVPTCQERRLNRMINKRSPNSGRQFLCPVYLQLRTNLTAPKADACPMLTQTAWASRARSFWKTNQQAAFLKQPRLLG